MWIPRLAFDNLTSERIKACEEARVLSHQNEKLQITMAWAFQRVEHLERQNARLLYQFMGIKLEVPVAVPTGPQDDEALGGANLFQDIGDDEAKKRGIEWDEHGAVKQ